MSKRRIDRREFLAAASAAALATTARAQESRGPNILLRSSWQTVNIGDIAHTPGVLRLLEEHIPEAQLWLWPSNIGNGVEAILRHRFPKLRIVQGAADIQRAFADCDFLLHVAGPFLVAQRDIVRWQKQTGKPYGVYGITFSERNYGTKNLDPAAIATTVEVLSQARFVYFRDTPSLELAKRKGCTAPRMEFGPDGAFATDLADDERAEQFLKQNKLRDQKFLCCIPRYRYTPYWTVPERFTPLDPEKDKYNKLHVEADHEPLRQAITKVIGQTDFQVLLCPEDQTQMELGKIALYDRLTDEVRSRVVWRPDYWLTGEARSTYLRSAGLFGHEMHSPILCIGAGVPAIVCRWEEQTSKGWMWKDIGLEEWLFDMDRPEQVERIVPAVVELATDPAAARAKAQRAKQFVEKRQRESMAVLRTELGLS